MYSRKIKIKNKKSGSHCYVSPEFCLENRIYMVFTLSRLELLSFPVTQHCNSCCSFNCYLNPKSIFSCAKYETLLLKLQRLSRGAEKIWRYHGSTKRPQKAWFLANIPCRSVATGKELMTRGRLPTSQIKDLKSLNYSTWRAWVQPEVIQQFSRLSYSQFLRMCTSRKTLSPLASPQASSVQRRWKAQEMLLCLKLASAE